MHRAEGAGAGKRASRQGSTPEGQKGFYCYVVVKGR